MIPEKANTEDFPDKKLLCSLEGGSVSLAEKDNQFLVITEEYAVWDMLDGEDQAGLSPCVSAGVKVV